MADLRPQPIHFGRAICGVLDQAERREWWLSNGRGAYASGTVALDLTRRYHGLLVAPLFPPLGRQLLIAKADATLLDGDQRLPLFTNRWQGGVIEPAGHVHIEAFEQVGRLPVWRFAVGDVRIEQRIWMIPGQDTTCVAWRLVAPSGTEGCDRDLQLTVDLLANWRDHHDVASPGHYTPSLQRQDNTVHLDADGHRITIQTLGGSLAIDPVWVERFDLPAERERGLEDVDHHLRVATLRFALEPGTWIGLTVSANTEAPPIELAAAWETAQEHDHACLDAATHALPLTDSTPDWIRQLVLAADSYLFARPTPGVPDGLSVIAGYPWFGDWGRDTMIALPGLTLATGRPEQARKILETFARFVDGGMLPNVFPGVGETAEYNTVDAALWYIHAWTTYVQVTQDVDALDAVFPVLETIVAAYRDGTRYGIRTDSADGLVQAGEPGVQLTWMDAKVSDWVVTPRIGKPVEINALWYNALMQLTELAPRVNRDARGFHELAEAVRQGFQRYIRTDGLGLYDVLDGPDGPETRIRPNQILALSLDHSPLDTATQNAVLTTCARHLLTSYGLRSLAPSDPAYAAQYRGDVWARDGAYHQGPVWGWLLGHYALAQQHVRGDATEALAVLEPLSDHLHDAAVGHASEIFDGAPPHTPRGAPAQAWSVACTLEAWWRIAGHR